MVINKIVIDGFANIDSVELNIEKFNALVALNNYGKSNVIFGIYFGVSFIKEQSSVKNDMMAYKPVIPINKNIDNKSFKFQIDFITMFSNEEYIVSYKYSFDWIKNITTKGQRIKEEVLRVKANRPEAKFKKLISRNLKDTFYMSSQTGRCDKSINVQKDELAVNKLKNFDDLFYLSVLNEINKLTVIQVDTLQDPDKLFRRIRPEIIKTDYSLAVPESYNVAFFIYSLKQQRSDLFELFKDSIISLLPGLEDFEPVEIDLKKNTILKGEKGNLPLDFPEKLYDIRVKEINNNQQTDITRLSSGSQKLFYVLALTLSAEINNVSLVTFEELENSIHPGLLQKLLMILDGLIENTKIILTSHSPYLIQYLDIDKIKIGIPNSKGLANFNDVKKSRFKRIVSMAEEEGVSVGDFIFDKMIECSNGESQILDDLCK
jgi:predicted ATPase